MAIELPTWIDGDVEAVMILFHCKGFCIGVYHSCNSNQCT